MGGPGIAEMEITLRKSEPVVTFHMDKTEPGGVQSTGIQDVRGPPLQHRRPRDRPPQHAHGFRFEVWDIKEHKRVILNTPEELYDLLALIGAKSRYVIKRVFPKEGHKIPKDEPVAVISTEKLYQIAGEYVGKDDPPSP